MLLLITNRLQYEIVNGHACNMLWGFDDARLRL